MIPEKIILPPSFFLSEDVVEVARALVGKILTTYLSEGITTGRIVETEAYAGITDRASHAYGGRRTNRTQVMYREGGTAYIYLCYGMHHLTNVVTHHEGIPHAVLIRALEPMEGLDIMRARSGGRLPDRLLCSGPGRLSKAMGIRIAHTGMRLDTDAFCILDDGYTPSQPIVATTRIGVDYAGEDAQLPYRFILEGHPSVSGRRFA
ncbi:MAG: DNA-3-methyladenine glycosylase [Chitinophagia bacterium]|nr:DNA-3-methyladenine glycosylase [Chitinophagia bacterium]